MLQRKALGVQNCISSNHPSRSVAHREQQQPGSCRQKQMVGSWAGDNCGGEEGQKGERGAIRSIRE